MSRPVEVRCPYPACLGTVKATGRRSKQAERPRNHRCSACGRGFTVDMRDGKPVVAPA